MLVDPNEEVVLTTEGRPMDSTVELWGTGNHVPFKVETYSEDGKSRPFRVMTPQGGTGNTLAVRNTGPMEFPLASGHPGNTIQGGSLQTYKLGYGGYDPAAYMPHGKTVDGGATHYFNVAANVRSLQISLTSEGLPIQARVEVLQGPNTVKQMAGIYSEDGLRKPFVSLVDLPGQSGGVVRIINDGPLAYPLRASVEPVAVGPADVYEYGVGAGYGGDLARSFEDRRQGEWWEDARSRRGYSQPYLPQRSSAEPFPDGPAWETQPEPLMRSW